ncbi:hypothetical protein [Adhaeribacter soli]|uniref:Uncharacterized protein n=1 Tax=Adhaeribacter soli TaxID=2607655 RepID=A0A5N1IZE0_9BACT|nr:hypothetical protein [Adhaeribacter soli]KAA9338826.1 hypothetical protein F0P94_08515 [Adhaeribacter soli]
MVHPKDFGIDIYVGGGIWGPSFQAKLFTPDLLDHRRRGFKVNTLYILKGHRSGEPDTFKIKFNKDEIDSLYRLSYTYLSESYKSVQVRDKGMTTMDGPSISVSIIYEKKELACTEWDMQYITSPSKEAGNLFSFINKRLPKEFKLY